MRIAFCVQRRGFVKVTAPVINEALKRGHKVWLIRDITDKPGEHIMRADLNRHWPHIPAILHFYFKRNCPDADVVIGDSAVIGMTDLGTPRYALDYILELRVTNSTPGVVRCWTSKWQQDMFSSDGVLCNDGAVTGMTALDALPLVDPDAERKRWNLSGPVCLLLAPKMATDWWRRTMFKHVHAKRILGALRDFCAREHMTLVVADREKARTPDWLKRLGRYVPDTDLWPPTIARLSRVADLAVHFQSGAVHELAQAGVPQISIRLPRPDVAHFRGFDLLTGWAPYSLHHFPGVVTSWDWTEAADNFRADRALLGMDESRRAMFLERFNGPPNASARVLDYVEARA